MYKLDLEKAEKPKIKLSTSTGSKEEQENSRKKKISFFFIDYTKAFVWMTANCGKFLKRQE